MGECNLLLSDGEEGTLRRGTKLMVVRAALVSHLIPRSSHLDAGLTLDVAISAISVRAIQTRLETTKDPLSSTDSRSLAKPTTMLYALRSKHAEKLGLPVCSSVVTGRLTSVP